MPEESHAFPPLIRSLLSHAECYPHPVGRIRLEETHISWVILTGDYAYKIKKPVDFGFLDFTTLSNRRRYCEEELRLNRRLAGELYIDVVRISGSAEAPTIAGSGQVIEYAVRMHQFSASALASDPLQMNRFTGDQLDDLAVRLAQFHQSIGRSSSANQRGGSRGAHRAVLENFAVIKERCADPNDLAHIASLECWMNDRMAKYADLLDRRSGAGAVRECHGDLHLGNLVVLDGMLVPFDCIEFSEELRWIDVMSEIAFLVMDLEFHGLRHLAWRFLNRYLTATGDYEGLPLLRYFLIYRAMVRAKIALLSAGTGIGEVEARQRFRPYLQYGMDLTKESAAGLMILHGFSGSGKSVLAGLIAEWLPAIWLRSDVERKRLAPQEDRPEQRYAPEQTERTYERLSQLAGVVVQSGYPVVVDATFLQSKYRQQMKMVASSCDAPFVIIDIQCPIVTMRQRVEERSRVGTDPSEATVAVLAHQLPSAEPLEPAENEVVWVVSGDTPFDRQAALSELRSRLRLND